MKNLRSVFTLILFVAAVSLANAQAVTPDFFVGKWDVMIKGTPSGDVQIPMSFSINEGKLIGKITNPETKEEETLTSAEIKGDELVANFSAGGYDVTMVITKKDDDHFVGKLMDMIDVEGTRIK